MEEEKEEVEEEREEEEEEKEEEDDFVVKVDLSDEDVSQGEGWREEWEEWRVEKWRRERRLMGVCRPLNFSFHR